MSYGVFASVYDLLTENVEYEKISDRICSLLSLNGIDGGLLLDLGCGTGSLSFLLEKRGFDIIGADASEDMLAVANEKKYENSSRALFLHQSGEELDLYGTVDCAVCCLDTVNHIESAEKLKRVFQKVSLFMNRGGMFIFDINTEYKHREILGGNTFVYDLDEVYCVWQNSYIEKEKKTEIELDFFIKNDESDDYSRFEENFCEYVYTQEEITDILGSCGFKIIGQYDGYGENPVTSVTERITFAAVKE